MPSVPGGVCWRWIGGGVGGLLLDLGSPVLGGALAGLGFGVEEVDRCIKAALGLVCLARFERSRSLGLGWPGLRLG